MKDDGKALSRETFPAAEALPVHNVCTGLQLPFVIELVRNVQDGGVRPVVAEQLGYELGIIAIRALLVQGVVGEQPLQQ